MKVLITGASGFIGKNLCVTLKEMKHQVLEYDRSNTVQQLKIHLEECDFIMHLAGINRPLTPQEFYDGNCNFTIKLLEMIKQSKRKIPLLLSSSIQAEKDNDYGKSKKMAEDAVMQYHKETGAPVFIFRLHNAYGKWCKPNYNSVVATFCHNIARNLEVTINNPGAEIPFVYIDDIVSSFISCLGQKGSENIQHVMPIDICSVGKLKNLLVSFKNSRDSLQVPDMSDHFTKCLYSTYLSYLPEEQFIYPLKMNVDQRGSFTEILRSEEFGQCSINVAKSGITKGNHWHHTKNEKFLVVKGEAIIRFRKIGNDKIIEYHVSGDKLEVIDIPVGYTHNIENIGKEDLITFMWANESFDSENPDTFFLEV